MDPHLDTSVGRVVLGPPYAAQTQRTDPTVNGVTPAVRVQFTVDAPNEYRDRSPYNCGRSLYLRSRPSVCVCGHQGDRIEVNAAAHGDGDDSIGRVTIKNAKDVTYGRPRLISWARILGAKKVKTGLSGGRRSGLRPRHALRLKIRHSNDGVLYPSTFENTSAASRSPRCGVSDIARVGSRLQCLVPNAPSP
ncbi:hypothetical protein EVAR_97467_1 [Eumeta japonica]|uniref:Uncharacterized protein n=1 Tax=Eumeta variegata TaxID=151549 RepID=A0A4C1X164_EUMVA|nr:hypothetical protein EVAR_97467_1 [Eumeta japonica]